MKSSKAGKIDEIREIKRNQENSREIEIGKVKSIMALALALVMIMRDDEEII